MSKVKKEKKIKREAIDLSQIITNHEGLALKDEFQKLITVKSMLITYLSFYESSSAMESVAASVLSHKIFNCDKQFMEVNEKEITTIEKAVQTPRHVALAYHAFRESISNIVPLPQL